MDATKLMLKLMKEKIEAPEKRRTENVRTMCEVMKRRGTRF